MNPKVDDGLWLTMMCQCRLINCNKCTTQVGDVHNRGWGGAMCGSREYMKNVFTCCEPKTALICCMSQETQTEALYQPRGVGWGGRWEGGLKGEDIRMPMVDSC